MRTVRALTSLLAVGALMHPISDANATDQQQYAVTISRIRVVGDYQGATYDNTIELWPSNTFNWAPGSNCAATFRVYIDAKNKHLVAAAYLAFATDRKVDINVDDTLPIRNSSCEVSYLDLTSP